jgi:hypothetical protein
VLGGLKLLKRDCTITPHTASQMPLNEGHVQLAILSINTKQLQSNRAAAAIYNVPEKTIPS